MPRTVKEQAISIVKQLRSNKADTKCNQEMNQLLDCLMTCKGEFTACVHLRTVYHHCKRYWRLMAPRKNAREASALLPYIERLTKIKK